MTIATNKDRLVMLSVMGQVTPPRFDPRTPYRIGHDGHPRVVPATGGIAYNVRVGDQIAGLVGDHVEPAVSAKNPDETANGGFNVLSCIGNEAIVASGEARGARGVITGKHGGAEHVMIDFPNDVLDKLLVGDQFLVRSFGTGLAIDAFPEIRCTNLDPHVLEKWVSEVREDKLVVPVAKIVPAAVMGSGLGRDNVNRGDYDITLFDPGVVAEYSLDELRFGDFVAIQDADSTFGRYYRTGAVSIGIIVHGDSAIAGHGPGVTGLLCSRVGDILPVIDPKANLADLLGLR